MLFFNNKINQILIFILFFILFFIIINSSVQANNVKNSAIIFMYHKFGIPKYPSTNIKLDQFDKHLNEFSQTKYNIKSLDYIVDTIINDGDLPNNTIGISIDDADRSFLTTAWPRFKEKGFPVTLFVTTSTILDNNKNYMNWDEIRKVKSEGVVIGAHTDTHPHLPNLSLEQIKSEIEKSNRIFLKEIVFTTFFICSAISLDSRFNSDIDLSFKSLGELILDKIVLFFIDHSYKKFMY